MTIRVVIEGRGKVAEFPDGTSPEVIDAAVKRDFFSDTPVQPQPDEAKRRKEWVRKEKSINSLSDAGEVAAAYLPSRETRKTLADIARPVLEGGGAVGGGLVGAGSGFLAGAGLGAIPGTVAGASLGYAAGSGLADLISGDNPQTMTEAAGRSLKNLGTGAMYEMGGQAAVPVLAGVAKGVGAVAKPILGRISGTGTGAVDEAIKSGMQPVQSAAAQPGESLIDKGVRVAKNLNPFTSETAYDKALRGNISGEEIVESAKNALNRVKDARATAYQGKLTEVEAVTSAVDDTPVFQNLADKMRQYKISLKATTDKNGNLVQTIDTSRAAMGKSGRNDIVDTIEEIINWKDKTPSGMDALKRRLDDFYSDSSQARQFVASLRDSVKQSIVKAVPAYDEMTKGYSDATKVIKDIEAGLSLRKQGMNGRVTADQTLRRLMSSMRDNFELRKDLVEVLGKEGGADLGGMIAGYSQNAVLPRGLAGIAPGLTGGAAIAHFVDPWFASVLVASSPRVQGEFLRVWGKGMKGVKAAGPAAQKAAIMQSAISTEPSLQE